MDPLLQHQPTREQAAVALGRLELIRLQLVVETVALVMLPRLAVHRFITQAVEVEELTQVAVEVTHLEQAE
jgi:hypothetical protein